VLELKLFRLCHRCVKRKFITSREHFTAALMISRKGGVVRCLRQCLPMFHIRNLLDKAMSIFFTDLIVLNVIGKSLRKAFVLLDSSCFYQLSGWLFLNDNGQERITCIRTRTIKFDTRKCLRLVWNWSARLDDIRWFHDGRRCVLLMLRRNVSFGVKNLLDS